MKTSEPITFDTSGKSSYFTDIPKVKAESKALIAKGYTDGYMVYVDGDVYSFKNFPTVFLKSTMGQPRVYGNPIKGICINFETE